MLLTEYDDDLGVGLLSEGDPDDMTAHLDYLRKLNQELIDNGELVEVQGARRAKAIRTQANGHAGVAYTDAAL